LAAAWVLPCASSGIEIDRLHCDVMGQTNQADKRLNSAGTRTGIF